MRTGHSSRYASPFLTLLTGLCVTLTLAAIALAATSSLATAESGPVPAQFAVGADEVVISGSVVGVGDAMIGIQEPNGAEPVAFPVVAGATMSRDGAPVALTDLRLHDPVHLTVDRTSGAVLQIVAEAAPGPVFQPSSRTAAAAALGLIAGAIALALRWRQPHAAAAEAAHSARRQPVRRLGLGDLSLNSFYRRPRAESRA